MCKIRTLNSKIVTLNKKNQNINGNQIMHFLHSAIKFCRACCLIRGDFLTHTESNLNNKLHNVYTIANNNQIMHLLHLLVKFPHIFIRRIIISCTENNLINELDSICIIAYNNAFKVHHLNNLIVNRASNKRPEHKSDSRKYNLLSI